MFDEFLNKAAELRARGESFAVATVVRFEAPISGKPGDKAIIHADGKMWGWIGGGCAQPAVVKEALKALQDSKPRLIRISPSPNPVPQEGILDYKMTCHSGGTLDIYIEPVLPKPQIVILGRSEVAQTLARLGPLAGYSVSVLAAGVSRENVPEPAVIHERLDLSQIRITPQTFVVVSTQGEYDEEALEQALSVDARYVAFVASKAKAEKIFDFLRGKGIPEERLGRVIAPAGLVIGAVSPEEIAVSILAEIVQKGRTEPQPSPAAIPIVTSEAKDPVCGMTVDVGRAKHQSRFEGRIVYFCCARCKQAFDQSPQKYLVEAS